MLRASYWQWERHLEKKAYIDLLQQRLAQPPVSLSALISTPPVDWDRLHHRRVYVKGNFDFSQEVVLRNRRYKDTPGVHAITPLHIYGAADHILVDRGFLPLKVAGPEERKRYQSNAATEFVGLVKMSSKRKFLAPPDPPAGADHPWVDAWLRVDVPNISKQLPYSTLPVFLEIMNTQVSKDIESQIVTSSAGREELLLLSSGKPPVSTGDPEPGVTYPIPVFDTVIPPGRHFSYVFEWAFMALITLVICFVLQLRPPANIAKEPA